MSDLKAERLLNLTIALLATRKLLTKSDIFSSVAGYSGSQDAMERMFERDKDELRSIGIEIEVAPLDSLFDDELGYRIRPETYTLSIPDLTPAELGVLSVAAHSWNNALFSSSAQTALRRIESLGMEVDRCALESSVLPLDSHHPDFEVIWEAINERRSIEFIYKRDNEVIREVLPYRLQIFKGEWYLSGKEISTSLIKTFKLRRMSKVKINRKSSPFDLPLEFSHDWPNLFNEDSEWTDVVLRVRHERALSLRRKAPVKENSLEFAGHEPSDEWEYLTFKTQNLEELISEVLWHGPDVQLIAPDSLRNEIRERLKERASV